MSKSTPLAKLADDLDNINELSSQCLTDLEGMFRAIKEFPSDKHITSIAGMGAYLAGDWAHLVELECSGAEESLAEIRKAMEGES